MMSVHKKTGWVRSHISALIKDMPYYRRKMYALCAFLSFSLPLFPYFLPLLLALLLDYLSFHSENGSLLFLLPEPHTLTWRAFFVAAFY